MAGFWTLYDPANNTAVAAQNTAAIPYPSTHPDGPARPVHPTQQAQISHDLLQRQISHLQSTMDGLQHRDRRARESSSFATHFDVSGEVSLPL
jgi:hypothetical protein